ncbi:hypothetical protein CcaCcLH18_11978 [Colletotrichum camelliae]|nr:hypothetical protein CcaCcLH18_11978 [Colletotrichum camelliae]
MRQFPVFYWVCSCQTHNYFQLRQDADIICFIGNYCEDCHRRRPIGSIRHEGFEIIGTDDESEDELREIPTLAAEEHDDLVCVGGTPDFHVVMEAVNRCEVPHFENTFLHYWYLLRHALRVLLAAFLKDNVIF